MRKIVVAFIALWSMIVAGGGGSAQCAEINQANNTQIIRRVANGDGCAIVPAFFSFFLHILGVTTHRRQLVRHL